LEAIKDAIRAKDNSTDLIYHLKRQFPEYKDIKKFFNTIFDKNFLKAGNVITEEKSEIDKRKVEYKFDALHELYERYVAFCFEKISDINCPDIVINTIANSFMENYLCNTQYDLLDKIKKELESIFSPPTKERYRGMLGFIAVPSYGLSSEEILYREFEKIKDTINVDSLKKEIEIIFKILENI